MQPKVVLRRLGLPGNLVSLIRKGRLVREVDKAYARYDSLCARMDAFEAEYGDVARRLPWHEAREAWKAAGRPRPEWYEVLALFDWAGRQPFMARSAHLEWPRPPEAAERHRRSCHKATKAWNMRRREKALLLIEPLPENKAF